MTKLTTRPKSPVLGSSRLLNRLLAEPQLVAVVQNLQPRALAKLINKIGLEDSSEFLALATSAQIEKVFDEDLWRNSAPGKDETFDPERFGLWLEVLSEMGASVAAAKLSEMDEELLAMAISQHVWVVNTEEMRLRRIGRERDSHDDELTDKLLESSLSHEFYEYVVVSRQERTWDATLSILIAMDDDHSSAFQRLLTRCEAATVDAAEESGGLNRLLSGEEQLANDVASAREERRESEGHVTPSNAAAFFRAIRLTSWQDLVSSKNWDTVTQDYFRRFEGKIKAPEPVAAPTFDPSPEVLALLEEAEVIAPAQPVLLTSGKGDPRAEQSQRMKNALSSLAEMDPSLFDKRMQELSYLANSLVAGCSLGERRFRPVEAAEAALATCNLALEKELKTSSASLPEVEILRTTDTVSLFSIGWKTLYEEITLRAAQRLQEDLVRVSESPDLKDPWLTKQVVYLQARLNRCVKEGKPWEILGQLDLLIAALEPEAVDSYRLLLAEYPLKDSLSPEFFSTRAQIEDFIKGLFI